MLDDRDQALLAALERDARASVVALARAIGLSRSATQDRLARLQRSGAVRRYTIVRGGAARDIGVVALLMIRHRLGGTCAPLTAALRTMAEVIDVDMLAGEPDMMVRVAAIDAAALSALADRVRALPGVASLTTHVVLGTHRAGVDP